MTGGGENTEAGSELGGGGGGGTVQGGPRTAGPIRTSACTLSKPGALGGFQAEEGLDPTTGSL